MDASTQAQETVPAILLLGGGCWLVMLSALMAFVLSAGCLWLGATFVFWPLRQMSDAHWTERARLAYPGWVFLLLGPIILALISAVGVSGFSGRLAPHMNAIIVPVTSLAGFLGAGVIGARIESRVRRRPVTCGDWLRGWTILILLFFSHFIFFGIAAAFVFPRRFDGSTVAIIGAAVAVSLAFSLGGSLWLLRRLKLLLPASSRLLAIVEQTSGRAGVQPRATFLLRWKTANALAFPLQRQIAFTDTAVTLFSDAELSAVCAHELAHLKEPRRVTFARLAGQWLWVPFFAAAPIVRSFGPLGLLVAMGVVIGCGRLLQKMARRMEELADAEGRVHEDQSGTYARTLEKLYEFNLMPAIMRQKRLAHPHLYDRLLAANLTPGYPRPVPPSPWRSRLALILTGAIALLVIHCLKRLVGL